MFAIMPYIKTYSPVSVGGIQFRPGNDYSDLSSDEIEQLKTLCSMFFLRDDFRIKEITYAFMRLGQDKTLNRSLLQKLSRAQSLITYIYTTPQPFPDEPFFEMEQCALFLLEPSAVSKLLIFPSHGVVLASGEPLPELTVKDHSMPGYEGILAGTNSPFWVAAGCRIYPPLPNFSLNDHQSLVFDVQEFLGHQKNWALQHLFEERKLENRTFLDRIFTALEWHNRSTSLFISEEVRVLNLAIAFESLLNLKHGDDTAERVKESIVALIGHQPRVDSWADQFYTARSKIVHQGSYSNLGFVATDLASVKKALKDRVPQAHRPLTAHGRRIFRICLSTILHGAISAEMEKLSSKLVPNQERVERICEALNRTDSLAATRILSVAEDVSYLYDSWMEPPQLKSVLGAAKLMIETFLAAGIPIPMNIKSMMESLTAPPSTQSTNERLQAFLTLDEALRTSVGQLRDKVDPSLLGTDPAYVVRLFFAYLDKSAFFLMIEESSPWSEESAE